MNSTSSVMVGLSAIAIGLGVPAVALYFVVNYGFNSLLAAVVAFIGVMIGGGIIIVGITVGGMGNSLDSSNRLDRERLRNLRAQQSATLEELEEIAGVLAEIRDVLKSVEE